MLNSLHKKILRLRLIYLFYVILLNFLLYATVNTPKEKSFGSNIAMGISVSSSTDYSFATLDSNNKKVDRQNFNESTEYKDIHYSKYFYIHSDFLNKNIRLIYTLKIQDCITKYELIPSSLDLRSPPSLMA